MHDIKMREMFCRPIDERALLASAVKSIDNYYSIVSKLTPNDFLYEQHEMFMMILASLVAKGVEIFDFNLVISEAQANGVLENVGGLKYIQTINNVKVSDNNFEVYLNSVVESATKYRLYKTLLENINTVEDNAKEGLDSAQLLSQAESNVLDLSVNCFSVDEPKNLSDGLREFIEERRKNRIEISGISTGYPILDKQIDGMIPGTLLVLAARKKMGKSAFLSNISNHVAYRLEIPVLYVDTELTFTEWRTRALANISGVKEREIKHGGFNDVSYQRLIKAEELILKGNLFHEYMPGYSVEKLVSLYKKYKHKEDIGLIVFDYIKEPDSSSLERQRKEYQVLGDVTTKLKDLAGKLNIPALTAVQLNRDNDIADSDRIARYADVICHWGTRDKEELDHGGLSCGTHKLVIKDTRRGGTTGKHGIGYNFFKENLEIREVTIDKQYFTEFDKVMNESSADINGYENEELS